MGVAGPVPEALTPRMMCCGGILTTTRRVASSLGPQVLMPSIGDRSVGSERGRWRQGHPQALLSRLPDTLLPT